MQHLGRAIGLAAVFVTSAAATFHPSVASAAPAPAPARSSAVCASLHIDASVAADVRAVDKAIGEMLGCKDAARDPALAFWTDTPSASQMARLAVVADCLPPDMDGPRDLIEALRCYPDVQALDRAKLDVELEADARLDASAKTAIRATFDRTRMRAETWSRQAKALAATNPEARAVLFDAPARAIADWNVAYASNKEALDAALAFAARIGTEGVRGCSSVMRQHLATYLAKKNAATLSSTSAAMSEALGYAIVDTLAQCEQLDGEPLAAHALSVNVLAKTSRWHRGPRLAAYWAGVDALDASDGAQRLFGASFGVFRKLPRERTQMTPRAAQEHEGTIASLKASKGGVLVSFTERSAAPVLVAPAHASGLATGRKVVFLQESGSARAFPLTVFVDREKTSAAAVMGTTLAGAPPTASTVAAAASPIASPAVTDKKARRSARR